MPPFTTPRRRSSMPPFNTSRRRSSRKTRHQPEEGHQGEEAGGARLVGRMVRKAFEVPEDEVEGSVAPGKRRMYDGEVVSYNADTRSYAILYEDDDSEEVGLEELRSIMVDEDEDDDRLPVTPRRAAVVTPDAEESNEDGDEDYVMNAVAAATDEAMDVDEDEDEDEVEEEKDEGLLALELEEEVEDLTDKKPPSRKAVVSAPKKKRGGSGNKRRKQRGGGGTARPAARKKLSFGAGGPPTSNGSSSNPRSVASRGLPRGSLAVGRGGFEVRTLDGVAPLLTSESVSKASKFVREGRHQEAARLLRVDGEHHSIAAFCDAARAKLGIAEDGVPAAKASAKASSHKNGGYSGRLSERAQRRLEEGTVGAGADLPGRLLVVSAGTAVDDEDDGVGTGEPLCPPELVGRVFESAAELHELTHNKVRLATYDMDATGDPSFGPWGAVVQRLDSAGLLPKGDLEDGDDEDTPSSASAKRPFVVRVDWDGGDSTLPKGSWQSYRHNAVAEEMEEDSNGELQWALIEGATRDAPPVLLGVSPCLIAGAAAGSNSTNNADVDDINVDSYCPVKSNENSGPGVLPSLSPEVAQVRLPASLLQKAIRRNFCSPAPILEACQALLNGKGIGDGQASNKSEPPRGGVFQMLSTTWRSMLEDASPFDAPVDGSLLGFEELLLLSLVASADASWKMPPPLLRKAVATAIRAQQQPADFAGIEKTPDKNEVTWVLKEGEGRAVTLQNALLVMRAAVGGSSVYRSSFEKAAPIKNDEAALVDFFERGVAPPVPEARLMKLDEECRLSAFDSRVSPASLLLLQATLPQPPNSWKKHSLPAIAKQVQKLITDVNARMPDHHRLTRIAAWGKSDAVATSITVKTASTPVACTSAREVVTSTGALSDKEHQIIDCFEAVQTWRIKEKEKRVMQQDYGSVAALRTVNDASTTAEKFLRTEVGSAPTAYDGRVAFLLAFAKSEEIEVFPEGRKPEVVNVLFCGDLEEPLLVQRIGEARKQAAATVEGIISGSSGAKAVPSLGYVRRSGSEEDRLLVEAAQQAVAKSWKGGRTVSLPLPPPGFQWKLTDSAAGLEEQAEQAVKLTATLSDGGVWNFTIGGIRVEPFDARSVISPCSLNTQNHKPLALGSEREGLLKLALYHQSGTTPDSVLRTLKRLHELAENARRAPNGADEGLVYDWLLLATKGSITARIWRDAILALKTREKEDVILGPVLTDGTCRRDMTEGCVLRIFCVLESLYPTALIKSGALKWRVRPRGAGYNHMLVCLEQLSRGTVQVRTSEIKARKIQNEEMDIDSKPAASHKRKQRGAAALCKKKITSIAKSEVVGHSNGSDDAEYTDVADRDSEEEEDLSLPEVTTELWPHQQASADKVVAGVMEGRRGHADASAVGAGKTLTALATIVRLAKYMKESHGKRNGVLVMLPTKALVKEWLLQIAAHTSGFHVIEQREDGQLFSLTYGKSTPPPPIDGNTIVITTLDRVRVHPFVRQAAWDFVIIDECLAVQNAAAKRCPSAWRQIEVSTLGVLMLSATFFRSKYSDLFYMIRMLRTAFPRSMEYLSATIHEHIVCQVPETDRAWEMRCVPVALPLDDLAEYRKIIEAYKRKQLNSMGEAKDFRRLFIDLASFLRIKYEGREGKTYSQTSIMAEACFKACKSLLQQGHRPLVFADTSHEAKHLLGVLCEKGLNARTWASVARESVAGRASKPGVVVAVKSVEGQGINMQSHADAIVCRPTPGDHLEQMKGRIDRPGQTAKNLVLVVLMAEHTIEEAKAANTYMAGNFFRDYLAPVATRYRERIDLEATLAAGGKTKLKSGTVAGAWRRSLEAAGQSGAFARSNSSVTSASASTETYEEIEEQPKPKCSGRNKGKAASARPNGGRGKAKAKSEEEGSDDDRKFAPLNKVLRNKGDPEAVRQAKIMAKKGNASLAVQRWLFSPKKAKTRGPKKDPLDRFSDATPPLVLDSKTIREAVAHLSKDPQLADLIARVGVDALIQDGGDPTPPTQAGLFNTCVRAITFTMVSLDAGNAFLRRLAIKLGVCIENMTPAKRKSILKETLAQMQEGGSGEYDHLTTDELLKLLLAGRSGDLLFTPRLLGELVKTCIVRKGKRTGYPHLCGVTHPCGKNDNHETFLEKAREHVAGGSEVSSGYSAPKASFLVSLVDDFESGKISAKKIAQASDREAAKMLIGLKGIGDWSAGSVLMHFLKRANVMLYGDLTVRNYLNDIYDIDHNDESETKLESAAAFPDTAANRKLIDAVAKDKKWEPYRSVVCLLMYHLQEENLVLVGN